MTLCLFFAKSQHPDVAEEAPYDPQEVLGLFFNRGLDAAKLERTGKKGTFWNSNA